MLYRFRKRPLDQYHLRHVPHLIIIHLLTVAILSSHSVGMDWRSNNLLFKKSLLLWRRRYQESRFVPRIVFHICAIHLDSPLSCCKNTVDLRRDVTTFRGWTVYHFSVPTFSYPLCVNVSSRHQISFRISALRSCIRLLDPEVVCNQSSIKDSQHRLRLDRPIVKS